jgi:glycosyltransferase involved in cell wall biosynthesis
MGQPSGASGPSSSATPSAGSNKDTQQGSRLKLTVVIPVYNERSTIPAVLLAVTAALPDVEKEIIVVDDGSRDGTREWLRENLAAASGRYARAALDEGGLRLHHANGANEAGATFRVIEHAQNIGKGRAVRTGLAAATGDVVVFQDADLEYDPRDWERMLPLITERRVADVVYGSRFYGQPHRSLLFHHYLGNRLISLLFNLMYNQTLTDIEVCYKMFRHEVLDGVPLTSDDFGIEVEISAAIARARRWRIYEIGISYFGRTYEEGKKINWKDGVKALWYLIRFRM